MDLIKKLAGIKEIRSMMTSFVVKLLLVMFFMEFVKGALIVTILPDYMGTELRLPAFAIGLSLSLQYIGDSVLRSPIGWLIDRIGYRWCVLFGVFFAFLSVLLLSTQHSFGWIVVACVLLGAGTSPLWPAVIAGATESIGDQAKGTLMSVIYLAWLSGIGSGPVVINFFIHHSYSAAFQLLVVMMSVILVIALFLPGKRTHKLERPMKPTVRTDRVERMIRYVNNVRKSVRIGVVFYFALFAQTFALGLITPVLTLYARSILRLSAYEYSFLLVFGGAIAVTALIPMGRLVDRFGTKWFLHAGFIVSGAALLAFTYSDPGWLLYLLVSALGIGYAMIIPAWNALIAEAIPQNERGTVWGFILTIEGLGTISGPLVSGRLWDEIGYHAPFMASGCVLLLLFVIHIAISAKNKVATGS